MPPIIARPGIPVGDEAAFLKHVCPPTFGGGPIDRVTPTVEMELDLLRGLDIFSLEGDRLPMWVIEKDNQPLTFPSPAIRVKEGDVVHAHVGGHGNTHTVHWHGIEPSAMNDGVGKHSFEISGHFTYQWLAAEAGTYFYHCHKNTPLHFEMGLYGLLIIDPPTGPGTAFTGGPAYDVEAFLVPDDIDSVWHRTLGHDAFMMGCDANDPMNPNKFTSGGILNQFRPDYFGFNGVMQRRGSKAEINAPGVAITARQGQRILLRCLNAAYDIAQFSIGLPAQVIAMDGRPLGGPTGARGRPNTQYASPFTIPAGRRFNLSTARRWDLLITAPNVGRKRQQEVFNVTVEFFDYLTRVRHHTARTTITVTR